MSNPAAAGLRVVELTVVSAVIGGGVGLAAAAMPNTVRVLGLFAAVLGALVAAAVRWSAIGIGVRSPRVITCLAVVAAMLALSVYIGRAVQQHAAAEAPKNGRERVAEILLEQLPEDVLQDIPVAPLPRWVRWRTSSLGLTGIWPTVVGVTEVVVCLVAAGTIGSRRTA